MQRRATHAQVGDRLAADFARIHQLYIGTHQAQDFDRAGARLIDTDMAEFEFAAGGDRRRDEEKRGRRDIRGHVDVTGRERLPPAQSNLGIAHLDLATERAQHALAVIAGRRRFAYPGLALGVKPSQQQAGLDLGRCHRHVVMDGVQSMLAVHP